MEFKADSYGAGLKQVLHMTTGGKGIGSGAKYGDRTLVVWTDPAKGILICSAVNGKVSFCGPASKYFKPLPAVGEWLKIEVGQEKVRSKMIYSISIDGTQRFSIENTHPAEFKNVKVFASSEWFNPLGGSIRNLRIENNDDGEFFFMQLSLFVSGQNGQTGVKDLLANHADRKQNVSFKAP